MKEQNSGNYAENIKIKSYQYFFFTKQYSFNSKPGNIEQCTKY